MTRWRREETTAKVHLGPVRPEFKFQVPLALVTGAKFRIPTKERLD
jgi:hypothetical protein